MTRLHHLVLLSVLVSPSAACSLLGGAPAAPAPGIVAAGAAGPRAAMATGPKPYSQVITAEAVADSGLFTVHRIGEHVYFEIPHDMLGREMLLVSRIARTATNMGHGGQRPGPPQVVRWERNGDDVLLRTTQYDVVASDSLPIARAVEASHFAPIARAFPIEALSPDGDGVVIEVTGLYASDVPLFGLPSAYRTGLGVRRLDESRTFIESVRSYPENIEVRHVLTYEAANSPSNSPTGAVTVEMSHSMVLLPAEPMRPRVHDARVGYFSVRRLNYGLDAHRAAEERFITRWRLEPSDTAAFLRGEPVEPVEPIVYYIDPATPVQWRSCIKRGVEDWQVAFEAAGFRNAILAKDPPTPEEDPEFSPEDVRYSVIRYFPSEASNAYGPHVADPRSGEILESDIGWHHNILKLLRNWYLVQTAAANPEARRVRFDDRVMCRLVRNVAAHEVGHTLGLQHNMKASAAYPVDSLRSADFTREHGTTPSIMDYARFNYVAQPGDGVEAFVPVIGPYDAHAIRWGYRPILDTASYEAERDSLHAWIKAKADDPRYRFGDDPVDPTAQVEALGDDAVRASTYGIANLKRILPRLEDWVYAEGSDYAELAELHGEVVAQWGRYMGHVVSIIGGVVETRKTMDQDGPVYRIVPERRQKRAMRFLVEEALHTPQWLFDDHILLRIGRPDAFERVWAAQSRVLGQILDAHRLARLTEAEVLLGDEAYTLPELLLDLRHGVWSELTAGRAIDVHRRGLQRAYVERVIELLDDDSPASPSRSAAARHADSRPYLRGELRALDREIRSALPRIGDPATRLHLEDIQARIQGVLRAGNQV